MVVIGATVSLLPFPARSGISYSTPRTSQSVLPSGRAGRLAVAPASHPALVCYAARGLTVHRRAFRSAGRWGRHASCAACRPTALSELGTRSRADAGLAEPVAGPRAGVLRRTLEARVVEYEIPDRAGNGKGETVTLITTITGPADAAAATLAAASTSGGSTRPATSSSRPTCEARAGAAVGVPGPGPPGDQGLTAHPLVRQAKQPCNACGTAASTSEWRSAPDVPDETTRGAQATGGAGPSAPAGPAEGAGEVRAGGEDAGPERGGAGNHGGVAGRSGQDHAQGRGPGPGPPDPSPYSAVTYPAASSRGSPAGVRPRRCQRQPPRRAGRGITRGAPGRQGAPRQVAGCAGVEGPGRARCAAGRVDGAVGDVGQADSPQALNRLVAV
jgi:hypothetical protein